MKAKSILFLALILSVFTGCKDEKAVDDLKVVQPKVEKKVFTVVVEVIAKVEDDFGLLYTEDGTINFFTIPAVWQHVKASDEPQEVTFYLPEDALPTQIRVDFGMKQEQPNIVIKGFKLLYGGKTFQASGPDVFKYFRPDDNQCTANPATGEIIANIENGKRQTPSLYPIEAEMTKAIQSVLQ